MLPVINDSARLPVENQLSVFQKLQPILEDVFEALKPRSGFPFDFYQMELEKRLGFGTGRSGNSADARLKMTAALSEAASETSDPQVRKIIKTVLASHQTAKSQHRFLGSDYRWTGHPRIKDAVTPETSADQIKEDLLLKDEHLTILAKQHAFLKGERFPPNLLPSDVDDVVRLVRKHLDPSETQHQHELDAVAEQVKANMKWANDWARMQKDAHRRWGDQYK